MSTIFGIICGFAGFFYLYRFLNDDFEKSINSDSQDRQISKPAGTVITKPKMAPSPTEPQSKTAPKQKAGTTARKTKPAAKRSTSANPKSAKKSTAAKKKTTAKAAAKKTDDLTRINGIGPKTGVFLNSTGINSYLLLAKFDPAKLSALLQKEGIRVRQDDPQMWAEQATFAAKADWDGLSRLQQKQKSKRQGSVEKVA